MNISAGLGVAVREFPLNGRGRLPALRRRQGHRGRRGQARRAHAHRRRDAVRQVHRRAARPACRTYRLPLPFAYESTGAVTQFTNLLEPDARSREVFTFHRPEELAPPRQARRTRCARPAAAMPPLDDARPLGACRSEAIENLEAVARRQPAAGADPDGDRQRQDLHRRQRLLPADQVRRGQAHPVPGGPHQPRPADAQRVPAVRQPVQRLQVHRGVQRPAPAARTRSTRPARSCITTIQRLYSMLKGEEDFDEEQRGRLAVRGRDARSSRSRCRSSTTRDPHRDLRLHRRRRVPPLDLQPLAAGARVLRRLPDRPDRHADQQTFGFFNRTS